MSDFLEAAASSLGDSCAQVPSSGRQDQTVDKCCPCASELTLVPMQGLKCSTPVISVAAASSAGVDDATVNADHAALEDLSCTPLSCVEMPVSDTCPQERTQTRKSLGCGAEAVPAHTSTSPCEALSNGSGALSATQKPSSSSLGEHRTRVSVAGAFALLVTAYLQTQIPP